MPLDTRTTKIFVRSMPVPCIPLNSSKTNIDAQFLTVRFWQSMASDCQLIDSLSTYGYKVSSRVRPGADCCREKSFSEVSCEISRNTYKAMESRRPATVTKARREVDGHLSRTRFAVHLELAGCGQPRTPAGARTQEARLGLVPSRTIGRGRPEADRQSMRRG